MIEHVNQLVLILQSLAEAAEEEEFMIAGALLNDVEPDDDVQNAVFNSLSEDTQDLILSFQDVVDDIYMAGPTTSPVELAESLRELGYSVHDLVDDSEVVWTHYLSLPFGHLRF
jgi:hypothetical protein